MSTTTAETTATRSGRLSNTVCPNGVSSVSGYCVEPSPSGSKTLAPWAVLAVSASLAGELGEQALSASAAVVAVRAIKVMPVRR